MPLLIRKPCVPNYSWIHDEKPLALAFNDIRWPEGFSVHSMSPNQAVSVKRHLLLNKKYNRMPPSREIAPSILEKTGTLLKETPEDAGQVLRAAGAQALFFTGRTDGTPGIPANSVSLVVTSPPFLGVVDYEEDNWLRLWFAGIYPQSVHISSCRQLVDWQREMTWVFHELHRVLVSGGHDAFEDGEIRAGTLKVGGRGNSSRCLCGPETSARHDQRREVYKDSKLLGALRRMKRAPTRTGSCSSRNPADTSSKPNASEHYGK